MLEIQNINLQISNELENQKYENKNKFQSLECEFENLYKKYCKCEEKFLIVSIENSRLHDVIQTCEKSKENLIEYYKNWKNSFKEKYSDLIQEREFQQNLIEKRKKRSNSKTPFRKNSFNQNYYYSNYNSIY